MMENQIVRELALSLPQVEEHDHQGRPSFRINGKIFATLWDDRVVLKLSLADQTALTTLDPRTFSPVPGAWGGHGWTNVKLDSIEESDLHSALIAAWKQVAPKRLIKAFES